LATLLAGFVSSAAACKPPPAAVCETERILFVRGPGGYDAIADEIICDGFGGSDQVAVYTVSAKGSKTLVLRYGRKAPDPSNDRLDVPPKLTWDKSGDLRIAIDEVAFVRYRATGFASRHVILDIGNIDLRPPYNEMAPVSPTQRTD
jgi:hypothetical protein